VAGKQVIIVSMDYAPGVKSVKHRHPGPVFAYVAQGTMISQIGTAPPITYDAGQTWYSLLLLTTLTTLNTLFALYAWGKAPARTYVYESDGVTSATSAPWSDKTKPAPS
jgi:hypothetical protein